MNLPAYAAFDVVTDILMLGVGGILVYVLLAQLAVPVAAIGLIGYNIWDFIVAAHGLNLIDYGKLEISNGYLTLRISVMFLCLSALYRSFRYLSEMKWGFFISKSQSNDNKTDQQIKDSTLVIGQYGIYILVAIVLFYSKSFEYAGIWISVLSWALLFIVDDWNLIADYIEKHREHVEPFHLYRIVGFNVFLVIGTAILLITEAPASWFAYGVMALLLWVSLPPFVLLVSAAIRLRKK